MNILIPDSWLRTYLKTDASPKQIKDCVSLCGPSVERIYEKEHDVIYDIEITSNRPDAMSVSGIAREASVILPKFGIDALYVNDPYTIKKHVYKAKKTYEVHIQTDPLLNPRFSLVVLDNIINKESPPWMQKWLTLAGMRPINCIVDITNYLMKAFGQPVHAFDFDQILPDKNGIPTMILRASKKGETIVTLDGKKHTLPGDDIVIEDGSGRLIDLCGIMGGGVSHITDASTNIALFVQTYDPTHIRKTSMALAHRTEAAGLFEKGVDTELVMPTLLKGIELIHEFAHGTVASPLYDVYPHPYKPYAVSVTKEKLAVFLGTDLSDSEIKKTLLPLGLTPTITKTGISVTVPSWRRDITIDVDIIEEIARIYGYHKVETKLPDTEPPVRFEDPILQMEYHCKNQLKDWGYTEILSYSFISKELMDIFALPTDKAYTIANPLSEDWIYMRPSILPSMLNIVKQNLSSMTHLSLFELSMEYHFQKNAPPKETPILIVAKTGNEFYRLKGLAEVFFEEFGIPFPEDTGIIPSWFNIDTSLSLGSYGIIGEIDTTLLQQLGITKAVTVLLMDMTLLQKNKKTLSHYQPIPKYPASFEDIALTVPEKTLIGPMMNDIKNLDSLIYDVTLLDQYQNTKTLHITYQSALKNLTGEDIRPIREKILQLVDSKYQATLKTV
jgi:phenylalanyl-tRNA synthetase beta chain